jgi:UDP-glucose 4-epimerase
MQLRGKKVLVTGAGGFVGSHLADALVRHGCNVRAMLHYDARAHRGNLEFLSPEILGEIEIVSGDVVDPFFVAHAVKDREVVFHLAALIAIPHSYIAPASYVQTNVVGTLNILEACRLHDVARLVHTSTSECYGTARYTPIDEEHPLQGQSPYSASKIGADKVAESYHLSFGVPVATLRPFNTYGPRQSARAVLPSILAQLLAGRPELRLGDTEPVRDLTFVGDTVDGFMKLAECDDAIGQVVNVGTGRAVKIGELAELAMKLAGRAVPIVCDARRVRPANSEVRTLLSDAGKADRVMGWKPRVALESGIEQTARFIRDHLPLYRPEEYAR